MHSASPDPLPEVNQHEEPDQRQTRRGLQVRIEFVVLDGEPGKHLARRQAKIMRKVLQHIAQQRKDHPEHET